ncbi:IS66 family insertion sequence element accessory protein TnpA [Photobacterium leiognathi]|uniref:IS66 family insertion sequence element accessory protein TnpA n=1 Tax=Photobacterium leiognathi TaxID=553611 RepID=UPI002736D1A8|nr:IS66 family insertion sequence element accessory protein TnpB [Photobacterium leiognathi]
MTQVEKHQHWINIISNQQESGLSVPQFCKQHDINYATFHYWLKKLKQTDEKQIIHQVIMNDSLPLDSMVVVHLPNGLKVELPTSLSLAQIQTWLKALQ